MHPFVWLHLLSACVSGALGVVVGRRRGALGGRPFALLMAGVTVWSLGYALELASSSEASMRWWLWVQYLGMVSAPVSWLVFALAFAGYGTHLTWPRVAALLFIPALTLLLNAANPFGLHFRDVDVDRSGPFPLLAVVPGPWYWVFSAYSLLLLVIGSLVLVQLGTHTARPYRGQIATALVGAAIPFVATLAYLAGLRPYGHIDLTPVSLTFSGALFAYSLLRHGLFDLAPVARTHLFVQLADAVLVLDTHDRVVDCNIAAQRWLGAAIGQALPGALEVAVRADGGAPPRRARVTLDGRHPRTVEAQLSPMLDGGGRVSGRILLLHDVTSQVTLELEREQLIARLTAQQRALEGAERAARAERDFALQVMQTMGEGLTVTDADGRFTFVNEAYTRLLGYAPDEILGRTPFDVTLATDHATLQAARAARARGERSSYLSRLRHIDGSAVDVQVTGTPRVVDGQAAGAVAVITDLRERLAQEEALRTAEQTLHSFFDSAGVMMGIVELGDCDILHINDNALAAAFFGTTVEVMRGQWESAIGVSPAMMERWLSAYRESEREGRPVQFDYQHEGAGASSWLQATVCRIGPAASGRTRYSYVVTDITARKEAELRLLVSQQQLETANERLRELARTDGLTGLRNRGAFDERLAGEVARASRFRAPFSLLLLDIDHFKTYNDTFGHVAGDGALRTIAQVFQEQARQSDLVARYGGEEFAIILPNTDAEESALVAERIRRLVERTSWPGRAITVSIGAATYAEGRTAEQLIQDADRALYQAKGQGRNRVALAEQPPPPRDSWCEPEAEPPGVVAGDWGAAAQGGA